MDHWITCRGEGVFVGEHVHRTGSSVYNTDSSPVLMVVDWNRMKIASLAICYVAAVTMTLLAVTSGEVVGQDSVAAANLAAAKEISTLSGRPIFAIAGRST